MKFGFLFFFLICIFSVSTSAKGPDDQEIYQVDLDAPIPNLEALAQEMNARYEVYDPKYSFSWDMGLTFSPEVSQVISTFGMSETRIKNAGEDDLYRQIMALPKEVYPYIGPNLHAQSGISEKILNIPGIKETKNKFPEVIAPQLADIEHLEFLSPQLYILLMPEMWPSERKEEEKPIRQKAKKKIRSGYDPDFYASIVREVPVQGFGGLDKTTIENDERTAHPTKTSPLTGADIRAFASTIPFVTHLGTLKNQIKLLNAGVLLSYWESKNGKEKAESGFQDIVNPCQRLVLKAKWAGLEEDFQRAVGRQDFTLEEWAYTCDKTIKAYRVARMPLADLEALEAFKYKTLETYAKTLDPRWRQINYKILSSVSAMHKTTKHDVRKALENEADLSKRLVPLGGMLVIQPILN